METLWQDLRYTLRQLRRSPGFTAIIVLMLALGIGANSALFAIVNAVLLQPLPYPNADRVVSISLVRNGRNDRWLDGRTTAFLLGDRFRSLDAFAAWTPVGANLTGGAEPERLTGADVSQGFFRVLGVHPELGRDFTDADTRAGAPRVVTISHGLWVRDFGSDPHIIGRAVELDGEHYTVVGVMPAGFRHPADVRMLSTVAYWRPLHVASPRSLPYMNVIGRLGTGATMDVAASELLALRQRHNAELPEFLRDATVGVIPLHERLYGDLRPAMLILLGTVGCVLLIACANVANLLLARATARRKELALRAALGAARARLVRQLVVESVVLATAGGVCGLWVASFGLTLFTGLAPERLTSVPGIALNGAVVAFTLAISIVTGLLFGLAPALAASRTDLNDALKDGSARLAVAGTRTNPRRFLVAGELAMAIVLLIGAGLLVKSFIRFQSIDPGFRPAGVLTARLTLPDARYPDSLAVEAFFQRTLARVRAIPGVDAAALSVHAPLGSFTGIDFSITNAKTGATTQSPFIALGSVGPGYFRTYGIPLRAGREFTNADGAGAPRVAIINESLARSLVTQGSAIGKQLDLGRWGTYTVVGVVDDTRRLGATATAPAAVYRAIRQGSRGFPRSATIALHTRLDPQSLAPALRQAVHAVDAAQPLGDVATLEQILDGFAVPKRFNALLFGAFGALALVLAAFGLYGLIAYLVTQRTHEIGVRMALGAEQRNVLALVLRQGLILTTAGIVIGLAAAFALTRFTASLLFHVSTKDPVIFVAVPLFLVVVSVVATLLPARRAARVDPMIALRAE